MGEDVRDRAVDLGVAAPAPLVGEPAGVADAGDDQAVGDPPRALLVAGEPGDGADRARDEEEAVRVAQRRVRAGRRASVGAQHHAREVVVGERRMAAVGGDQDLVARRAGEHELAVGERAVGRASCR